MAQINSISNSSGSLTVDSAAASDSFIQLNINTTGEWRFGCDATDDSFRLSQGSALGTNDTFVMSASGELTMPLQPAFYAYNSSTISDVTGDGTPYTVIFNSEIYDQNSDYNTSTGTFTAPVTGRYFFNSFLLFFDISASHVNCVLEAIGSNRSPMIEKCNISVTKNAINWSGVGGSFYLDMDSSDTVSIRITISGSTKVIDIGGNAGGNFSTFNGKLIC